MANFGARLFKNSDGLIAYRLKTRVTGVKITTATVTATLTRQGTQIGAANRALAWDATAKLDPTTDADSGAYTYTIPYTDLPSEGPIIIRINSTAGPNRLEEVFTVPVVVGDGT